MKLGIEQEQYQVWKSPRYICFDSLTAELCAHGQYNVCVQGWQGWAVLTVFIESCSWFFFLCIRIAPFPEYSFGRGFFVVIFTVHTARLCSNQDLIQDKIESCLVDLISLFFSLALLDMSKVWSSNILGESTRDCLLAKDHQGGHQNP